jgi:hypothetical protein
MCASFNGIWVAAFLQWMLDYYYINPQVEWYTSRSRMLT